MNLINKYLGEGKKYIGIPDNPKQEKTVDDMKKKGWKIVMWDADFVGMVDKKGNPAEVYPDGKIKYPKRNY